MEGNRKQKSPMQDLTRPAASVTAPGQKYQQEDPYQSNFGSQSSPQYFGGSRAMSSPPPGFNAPIPNPNMMHGYRQYLIQQNPQSGQQYQHFYQNQPQDLGFNTASVQNDFMGHVEPHGYANTGGIYEPSTFPKQNYQPQKDNINMGGLNQNLFANNNVNLTRRSSIDNRFDNFHESNNISKIPSPHSQANISPSNNMSGYSTSSADSNGVIKPLIDNIVGSMMSNGTYTHFGPSSNNMMSPEYKDSNSARQSSPSGSPSIENIFGSDKKSTDSGKESPLASSAVAGMGLGRSSTPSDGGNDCNSRPQTPSKPSYSEILAKSANTSSASKQYRKGSITGTSVSSIQRNSREVVPPTSVLTGHRKTDYNTNASSSTTSSSCASSSSSPVSKQKSFSQIIVGRLFNSTLNKENTTSDFTIVSQAKTTPSTTPMTQRKTASGGLSSDNNAKNDRKVLSAFQNTGTRASSSKSKQKSRGRKSPSESTGYEQLDQPQSNSDSGWKICTKGKTAVKTSPTGENNKSYFHDIDGSIDNNTEPNGSDENESESSGSRRESLTEKRSSVSINAQTPSLSGSSGVQGHKNKRDKEKSRSRRDGRNCAVRRIERIGFLWVATMISAIAWLVKLVTDVFSLSVSVGTTLVEDFYSWLMNKALPTCSQHLHSAQDAIRMSFRKLRQKLSWKMPFRRKVDDANGELKKNSEDLLAALGPDRNIMLPSNGDEALTRLLSCKGQDPYSILGVRSDSSDETIRRYYKKQAVMVHPDKNLVVGAEEAFKILARAFELVGEPNKRQEYHNQLLEAHAKEQVYGEIGKLLEQLRKKMEIATSSIRCTKCNLRHKKNKTDRPLFAARYCAQCHHYHGAKNGELWAEKKGWFGLTWNYYTCMDCHIWEINEWAKCQKKNLEHIKADSHCVMYRLVAGTGNSGSNSGGQNSSGNTNAPNDQDSQYQMDPNSDWDALINNFCKASGGVPGGKPGSHFYQQSKGNNSNNFYPGGSSSSTNSTAGRKRKGRRK